MIIAVFLYKYLTADWLLNKICDFINKICLSLGWLWKALDSWEISNSILSSENENM